MAFVITIPIRLVSEANAHAHWRERQRRAKTHRTLAWMTVRSRSDLPESFPVLVTITRIAPRALDDDNLVGAAKHVRDGIADALGINDRSPLVRWAYAQRRGQPKEYAVEVRITRVEEVT